MSKIKTKPYIEKVLDKVVGEEVVGLEDLQYQINTNTTANVIANFGELRDLLEISHIIMYLTGLGNKQGIYVPYNIYADEESGDIRFKNACLICFKANDQQLELIDLDLANSTYEVIKEYCDINELRRLVFSGAGGGGAIDPESLLEVLHGSGDVIVDQDEEGEGVEVRLDLNTETSIKTTSFEGDGWSVEQDEQGVVIQADLGAVLDDFGYAVEAAFAITDENRNDIGGFCKAMRNYFTPFLFDDNGTTRTGTSYIDENTLIINLVGATGFHQDVRIDFLRFRAIHDRGE